VCGTHFNLSSAPLRHAAFRRVVGQSSYAPLRVGGAFLDARLSVPVCPNMSFVVSLRPNLGHCSLQRFRRVISMTVLQHTSLVRRALLSVLLISHGCSATRANQWEPVSVQAINCVDSGQRPDRQFTQLRTRPQSSAQYVRDTKEQTTFASDPRWEDWNADTTQTWRSMLSPFQLVRDETFNDGEPYGIAMFHQMHCIIDIRQHYSSLIGVNGTSDEDRELAISDKAKAHMAHCFNWLRQVRHASDCAVNLADDDSRSCATQTTRRSCCKTIRAVTGSLTQPSMSAVVQRDCMIWATGTSRLMTVES